MKKRTRWAVAGLLMLAAPVWAHCGMCGQGDEKDAKDAHAEIGKPAPDFTLKGVDGKEYKLADFKDKVVVLEWINHECPVVNGVHKKGVMKQTMAKFEGKPIVWLAIDSSHFCEDKVESIRAWVKDQQIDYPYLLDASGNVGHVFGAKTTPHMFVIDKKGVLAYIGAIDNNAYGQENDPRNYVVEAVSSVLKGSTVETATTKSYGCSVKYKK